MMHELRVNRDTSHFWLGEYKTNLIGFKGTLSTKLNLVFLWAHNYSRWTSYLFLLNQRKMKDHGDEEVRSIVTNSLPLSALFFFR